MDDIKILKGNIIYTKTNLNLRYANKVILCVKMEK